VSSITAFSTDALAVANRLVEVFCLSRLIVAGKSFYDVFGGDGDVQLRDV